MKVACLDATGLFSAALDAHGHVATALKNPASRL
jgi:hypothetical protein